jgi:hypothetical protein
MVELASHSSVDWSDSVVSRDKAEALKSKSQEGNLLGMAQSQLLCRYQIEEWCLLEAFPSNWRKR